MRRIIALSVVLLAVFSLAQCHGRPRVEGQPCIARNPKRCNESESEPAEMVMGTPEPVEEGFGYKVNNFAYIIINILYALQS